MVEERDIKENTNGASNGAPSGVSDAPPPSDTSADPVTNADEGAVVSSTLSSEDISNLEKNTAGKISVNLEEEIKDIEKKEEKAPHFRMDEVPNNFNNTTTEPSQEQIISDNTPQTNGTTPPAVDPIVIAVKNVEIEKTQEEQSPHKEEPQVASVFETANIEEEPQKPTLFEKDNKNEEPKKEKKKLTKNQWKVLKKMGITIPRRKALPTPTKEMLSNAKNNTNATENRMLNLLKKAFGKSSR